MSTENTQPLFHIQRIYLKSFFLDLPNAPTIFLEQQVPEVDIMVNGAGQALTEGVYESVVTVSVTAKIKDKIALQIEGRQAGIFEIRHMQGDQLSRTLGIKCPAIIYSYLRAVIADAILRAGFPPVHLAEVDFEALYQQRTQEEAEKQVAEELKLQAAPVIH